MLDPAAAPSRLAATVLPHVELLQWPAQEDRRQLLAVLGEPRVLLLAPNAAPPPDIDDLEHWVPESAGPATIVQGVTRLQQRILDCEGSPVLDDDGLLWFRGRWVAVADSQVPVIDLLIRNYQHLVRHEDVGRAYHDGGGGPTPAARRALMHRIAGRLAKVGLRLHPVRRRGFILTADTAAGSATGTQQAPRPGPAGG
jgi:hypothetical protein